MIDLTPLDVRNKRGDFRRGLRGYDPEEVDIFLELVAERLEALVRENLTLGERAEVLGEQVESQSGRERAVQEALVTAQELREDIRTQAHREAELLRSTAEEEGKRIVAAAEKEAERLLAAAERELALRREIMADLERKRVRFLTAFRALLERELDAVEVEEGRGALDDRAVDLVRGGAKPADAEPEAESGEDAGELAAADDLAALFGEAEGPDESHPAEADAEPVSTAASGGIPEATEPVHGPASLFDDLAPPPVEEPPVGVDELAPEPAAVEPHSFDPGTVPPRGVEPPVPTFEELMDESEGAQEPEPDDDGLGWR